MKFKAILLTIIGSFLIMPVAADDAMDAAARQHLRDKYTIHEDSFRPVLQLFEDGSQAFVCDKVELDYYFTLLQDDLDEGIDNYQNYAYLIDTGREDPVIRTNRYDMRGLVRKQAISMPQYDASLPNRLPFKIRSLKKDEGTTQWYVDVNDDYRGVQKDGKGMVGYDLFLSPFHIENDDHNNLLFKELVDIAVVVIRPRAGQEPDVKRYTLSKSRPSMSFEGGRIEVTLEQGMKHIRLVDDGTYGYGQLKFEVEGSSASVTKDPSKPLNDLPMGIRARFDFFDQKRKGKEFDKLDEVRILEEHQTPIGQMVHHVYSNDRKPGCSLSDLKKKHDKRVDALVNRMVSRFNQLDESTKQSLSEKYSVKTSQALADLMEHYDLNIYPFNPKPKTLISMTPKTTEDVLTQPTDLNDPVGQSIGEPDQSKTLHVESSTRLQNVAPAPQAGASAVAKHTIQAPRYPVKLTESLPPVNSIIEHQDHLEIKPVELSTELQHERLRHRVGPRHSVTDTVKTTRSPLSLVEPEKGQSSNLKATIASAMVVLKDGKAGKIEPSSHSDMHHLVTEMLKQEQNFEATQLPLAQQGGNGDTQTQNQLVSLELKRPLVRNANANQSIASQPHQSIPTATFNISGDKMGVQNPMETVKSETHANPQQMLPSQSNASKQQDPLYSKPKHLPATGVTEQSSWFLGSLLCVLGILLRSKR